MDTFCHSPGMINTKRKNANASERLNNLDELSEILKCLTIDSKINNSAYYNSDEYDAEGKPKSYPLVETPAIDRKKGKVIDTDTINRNFPLKY